MIAEEPQQITQGQVTNMVLDELQHRSNEAFYYHNAVQGAECAAIDRISVVGTSNIENGSDHADRGKAIAVSDLKIEENKVKEVKSCVALDVSHSLAYLSAGAKISEEFNYDTICKETLGVEKEKLGLLEKFVNTGGVACVYDHACGILGEVGNKQGEINFGAWLSDGKVTIDGFGENVLDALNRTVEKYDLMYNKNDKTK